MSLPREDAEAGRSRRLAGSSIWGAMRESLGLLDDRQRRRYWIAVGAQMATSFLDLAGVVLLGAVGLLASVSLSGGSPPSALSEALSRLGLADTPLVSVAILAAVAAGTLLLLKTLLFGLLVRRIFRFLGRCQASAATFLVARLSFASLAVIQQRPSQEVAYAVFSGTQAAIMGVLGSFSIVVAEVSLLVMVGAVLVAVDPLATLACIVFLAGVALLTQRRLTRWTHSLGLRLGRVHIETIGAVQEELASFREIKVLGREEHYVTRIGGIVATAASALADSNFIIQVPKLVYEAALVIGAATLTAVLFLTKDPEAAVASLALFLAAASRVVPALLRASNQAVALAGSAGQARAAYDLTSLLRSPAMLEQGRNGIAATPRAMTAFDPFIKIECVTFSYPGAIVEALSGVTIDVPAGSHLALVGPSGSGKSTLADVILGLQTPASGRVVVGGVPALQAIQCWPGGIAYVPQASAIADGSVRQNVGLGLPDELIDESRVWRALEMAHLSTVVRASVGGLDAPVGEAGLKLSGGQRQRLGLARALYTQPRLLVLDEATSALDAETETAIAATMSELAGSTTIVTIAHRLATVVDADQVAYLNEGRLVARGTFDEVRSRVPDFDRQARLLGLDRE